MSAIDQVNKNADAETTEHLMDLIDKGEIVNTKAALAFDEEIFCKVCKSTFTLAEANWEGEHPTYPGVKAFGLKCPVCDRVNVSYYKTPNILKLEKRLQRLSPGKAKDKARNKYEREFVKVQKKYGNLE